MAQYTIREISDMFQLPSSTLRYYEDMGILTNIRRTDSGKRIYEDCHVNRLRTICCFKNAGMSISQLKEFFSYESEESEHIDDILILLNMHKNSVTEQLKNLQKSYVHLLRKLHYYDVGVKSPSIAPCYENKTRIQELNLDNKCFQQL